MYLLGIDLGTSSVKAVVLDAPSGKALASAQYPDVEVPIDAPQTGWAEQDPEVWWECTQKAIQKVFSEYPHLKPDLSAIGIAYQMHGLVLVDQEQQVLRPSIIWCDSRAVEIGHQAFQAIGPAQCLSHLLNSPGNFTASKLRWVRENEPQIFEKIHKVLLPGDFLAMRLTGELNTTLSGLSEGTFWDFKEHQVASFLLDHYEIPADYLPEIVPTFAPQGYLCQDAASILGLPAGIPLSYRAGDQPNNALSLQVMEPGEVAATAGTSGVVYGVSDQIKYDPQSRINTFAHVNHEKEQDRLGVLLCINGTGILNQWLKNQLLLGQIDYPKMNELASQVGIGSDGLVVLPFGNGAERIFQNRALGGQVLHLDFNRHQLPHLLRAAQEGIVFGLQYGLEIMQEMGMRPRVIRAGHANMFLSAIFRESLAGVSGIPIELYQTDGAEGAARGAARGIGLFDQWPDMARGLEKTHYITPNPAHAQAYQEAYQGWKAQLPQ